MFLFHITVNVVQLLAMYFASARTLLSKWCPCCVVLAPNHLVLGPILLAVDCSTTAKVEHVAFDDVLVRGECHIG